MTSSPRTHQSASHRTEQNDKRENKSEFQLETQIKIAKEVEMVSMEIEFLMKEKMESHESEGSSSNPSVEKSKKRKIINPKLKTKKEEQGIKKITPNMQINNFLKV